MKEMKTVKEVAKQLGVNPLTIHNYIRKGLEYEFDLVPLGTRGKQKVKFVNADDVVNFRRAN